MQDGIRSNLTQGNITCTLNALTDIVFPPAIATSCKRPALINSSYILLLMCYTDQ